MDATGKTVGEVYDMADADRYATALVRARFYRERSSDTRRR
jgi:hypothetical protein